MSLNRILPGGGFAKTGKTMAYGGSVGIRVRDGADG